MELNSLVPQVADQTIVEGDGGAYYSWSTSKSPLLGEAKLGAGKLILQSHGFALPHFSDSGKIGYVLQGCCTVGMIAPNTSEEKVIIINKGDAIPVGIGSVSWWFNGGDTEVVVIFLGETTKAYIPGQFTYFLFTGPLGILNGFSNEFVSKAYNINEEEVEVLTKSQTNPMILKLEKEVNFPKPCKDSGDEKMVVNFHNILPKIDVKNGGSFTLITSQNFPLLETVGLGAYLLKIDANATLAPVYTTNSTVQVTYVAKGSGRIQMVGLNGVCISDMSKVQQGQLFVVPKFFATSLIADGEGMECFSMVTSSEPVFGQLAGKTSVWKALSPEVLKASLNVTPHFVEFFKAKIESSTLLVPPKK